VIHDRPTNAAAIPVQLLCPFIVAMSKTIYSGCQKNVPIAERFFATTLMAPSFFRNINMTSGITVFLGHFCDLGFWGYPANPLIIKQKISNT
jgi:hypothetical protein